MDNTTHSAPFQADFVLDKKSEVSEADDGTLTIEGFAADWLWDRSEEAFEPGAFEDGLKTFMETNPLLAYHHDHSKALGRVVEAKIEPEGLWVKAVLDKPAPGSWAEDVFNKVKSGTIRGFSVGGKFYRRAPDGQKHLPGSGPIAGGRIFKTDLMEISVTPLPANQRTLFEVAGKAFEDPKPDYTSVRERVAHLLDGIEATFDTIEGKDASHRAEWAKNGIAMKDGSFPITHCGSDSYSNGAARARAHSGNASESAIMAHIRKREKALGCKSSD